MSSEATSIRPLPAVLQKKAIEELNEVPARVSSDLEALRTWLSQQPHLKTRLDDQFLVAFLRCSKFSLEAAKTRLDKFYTMRTGFQEMFTFDKVDEMIAIFRHGSLLYLPTPLNDNGPRIGIMRLGAYPLDGFSYTNVMRAGTLQETIQIVEDDHACVNGIIYIVDLANITAQHILKLTPTVLKKSVMWAEEASPFTIMGHHFVNVPSAFDVVFNMLKPMFAEKTQKNIHMHGNKIDSLYEHIPRAYLPTEYGGDQGSIEEILNGWQQRFESYRPYYKEELNFGSTEKLRPGKPIDFYNNFGVDGSFRQLNVD